MPKPAVGRDYDSVHRFPRPLPRADIFGGKPDLVTGAGAIDRLQDEFKLNVSFSSPITTIGGSPALSATRSQPPTSP